MRMKPIFSAGLVLALFFTMPWACAAETVPGQPADAAAAPAAVQSFDIMEYRVTGNTVLPAGSIEESVYPYLGEGKTIQDVEQARAALEKRYHESGYLTVMVNIPEQKVDAGVVNLEVVEATVERLRIKGARYYALGHIRDGVPELAEGHVPHFPTVQQQLSALNRSQDRQVAPVLKPGRTPGTVSVDLKVNDQLPLHGAIELNDRYSANTTRWRSSANVRWDNLWQRQHSLSLSWLTAPDNTDDSKMLSATYSIPLPSGDYLAFYGVKSESNVAAVGALNVIGNGRILGARYIHPLPAVDGLYHTLTVGVDYKDFEQTVNLIGSDSIASPISYLPFTLGWEGMWNGDRYNSRLGLNLNFHLRGVYGEEQEFAEKRFKAHANYAYLRANAEHEWRLGNGVRFNFRFAGQLSGQPLISNEQFAVGGADTVRGYLESEAMGDDGYAAGLELHSSSLGQRLNARIKDLHVLAFVDGGETRVQDPLPGSRDSYALLSAGLGMRLEAGGWKGTFDYAWPLRDGGQNNTAEGESRWHVNFGYYF